MPWRSHVGVAGSGAGGLIGDMERVTPQLGLLLPEGLLDLAELLPNLAAELLVLTLGLQLAMSGDDPCDLLDLALQVLELALRLVLRAGLHGFFFPAKEVGR